MRRITLLVCAMAGLATAQVTFEELLDGQMRDPTQWLMYSGDFTGRRHSRRLILRMSAGLLPNGPSRPTFHHTCPLDGPAGCKAFP